MDISRGFRPAWRRNEELIQQSGHVTDLLTEEAIDWMVKDGIALLCICLTPLCVYRSRA